MVIHLLPVGTLKGIPFWAYGAYYLVGLGVGLFIGKLFWQAAWQQLKVRQLTMDTLISLGLFGSWTLGAVELLSGHPGHAIAASSEILFFVLIGRYLEEKARHRSQATLESLSTLATPTAKKRSGSTTQTIPTAQLQPGDWVEVGPGEIVPIDGVIVEGESFLQESFLTGEPLPVEKKPGHRVWAGTQNLAGLLVIQAEAHASETVLAQLITRLQKAQSTQAQAQRLADKVSAIFVPVVLSLAASTVVWHLFRGSDWYFAVERALSVLVISCPCALGLATPLAVQMAVGGAAQAQMLLREITQLENLPLGTVWAFDKTGTLTEGRAAVSTERWFLPAYAGKLLLVARRSQHPLAQALAAHLEKSTTPAPTEIVSFVELPGKGIIATLPEEKIYIGSPAWIGEKHPLPEAPQGTAVVAATEKGVIGIFTFSDPVRTGLKPFLAQLRQEGKKLVLLTGDPSPAGEAVAKALGLTEAHVGLTPLQKAQWIEAAQKAGERVVFVGDGINDALALQTAFVGIAVVRSAGVATQSAGIALLRETEEALPALYRLSRRLRRIIAQNLAWAFGYNLIALPLAMGLWPGVYVSPGLSALLMSLSSLTVVLNSLRVRLHPTP
jgi:heavy metal translocating P-type ATPase